MDRLQLTKKQLLALFLVLVVFVVAGFFVYTFQVNQQLDNSAAGRAFSEVGNSSLVDQNGQPVSLDVRDRQVTMVAFWATWAPQSAELLSVIDTVASAGEFSEIRFLAVNRDEPRPRVEAYFNTISQPTTVEIVTDTSDELFSSIESYAMPEVVVFDREGDIVWRSRGEVIESELRAALRETL